MFLSTRRDGPVEYLTLNRPDVRNAFNDVLVGEITMWARTVTRDSGVRAVVLAGAGPTFCAGADLGWMSAMATFTDEENVRDASAAAEMFRALDALPVPLIGRIHGAALGGGAGLVAVCDIAVADAKTTIGFTEVKLGIVPAIVSPYVVAKIGPSAARELFLTGMRIDAQRAKEIGLVHAVVPGDELDARVAAYVADVVGAGPEAVATAKALVKAVAGSRTEETIRLTVETIAARRASAEGREGMRAFLERRPPQWKLHQ